MSISIISTGSYRPKHVITNLDYEKIMDTSDAWIQQRTGIATRHFEDVSTVNMATQAAFAALKDVDPQSLECIIVGTYTPDSFMPTVANQVRANLGIKQPIPSFDLNAACSGFLYALQTAHAYIAAGIYRRILVIGVDFNSRYLNFEDRSSAILFGDGAGAVVIEKNEAKTFDCVLYSEHDVNETLTMSNKTDHPNPFFQRMVRDEAFFSMKGSDVFKFAIRAIDRSIHELLNRNNLTIDDIDYVISHQANQRILDMAARQLKIPAFKFLSNVANTGNTSSGSIPLLLDEVNREGILAEGMKIVLVAFGGGLTYGAALLEW